VLMVMPKSVLINDWHPAAARMIITKNENILKILIVFFIIILISPYKNKNKVIAKKSQFDQHKTRCSCVKIILLFP